MKKVLVVLSLMLFVGSLSTSVYAAMGTETVAIHKDDKKKKKSKKDACCAGKDAKACSSAEKKSCDKAEKEGAKTCCSKKGTEKK